MTSTVATLNIIGGKVVTARPDLDAICKAMGISDEVKKQLPAGDGCRYLLLLSSNGKVPKTCVDTTKSHMQLVQPGGANK
jgi:hypothetical protein